MADRHVESHEELIARARHVCQVASFSVSSYVRDPSQLPEVSVESKDDRWTAICNRPYVGPGEGKTPDEAIAMLMSAALTALKARERQAADALKTIQSDIALVTVLVR